MTWTDIIEIVAQIASILSLIISLLVLRWVRDIKINLQFQDNSIRQTQSHNKITQTTIGDGNRQAAGNINEQE